MRFIPDNSVLSPVGEKSPHPANCSHFSSSESGRPSLLCEVRRWLRSFDASVPKTGVNKIRFWIEASTGSVSWTVHLLNGHTGYLQSHPFLCFWTGWDVHRSRSQKTFLYSLLCHSIVKCITWNTHAHKNAHLWKVLRIQNQFTHETNRIR